MNEIDIDHTKNIVCPHCGHEHVYDLDEYFFNHKADIDCKKCEKIFFCEREFEYYYNTSIIPCKSDEPHKYRFGYKWKNEDIYICQWCNKIERRKSLDESQNKNVENC